MIQGTAKDYAAMKALGARCDECPLGCHSEVGLKKRPVPSEIRPNTPMIIAEAPGSNEDEERRPFVGVSGAELRRWLKLNGRDRYDISLVNTISCRPGSSNNLRGYLRRLSKLNKKRKKAKQSLIPSPIAC